MKRLFPLLLLLITSLPNYASDTSLETAIFAGGCFWCMEPPFDKIQGVKTTISGYIGGHTKNPSYKEVSAGSSGHIEALKITYDPSVVSYQELLSVFWKNIDPLDFQGQFCDKGSQYTSAIFYLNKSQQQLAQQSIQQLQNQPAFTKGIATKLIAAEAFYPAEGYHQNYYMKNPRRYKYYRWSCGRDQRLEQIWGAPTH